VLYRFTAHGDGAAPGYGALIFDRAGSIYGTTSGGGYMGGQCAYFLPPGCGVVFKLTPSSGGWTESVLHAFTAENGDGWYPLGGVTFDQSGNLYGTTFSGGVGGYGIVYQLTPSGPGWVENITYSFPNLGTGLSSGDLIFDPAGNLYGTGSSTNNHCCGAVFEITSLSGYSDIYSFPSQLIPRQGPVAGVVMDAAGNLYGTTLSGVSDQYGSVFKLAPSDGGWIETDLYDFTGLTDGAYPLGGVVLDANGNLYGTASQAGVGNGGVVWEITP
jgi:uncharacterized repeat protein (TIGR03803 family)